MLIDHLHNLSSSIRVEESLTLLFYYTHVGTPMGIKLVEGRFCVNKEGNIELTFSLEKKKYYSVFNCRGGSFSYSWVKTSLNSIYLL